jgi:hypothetical protein
MLVYSDECQCQESAGAKCYKLAKPSSDFAAAKASSIIDSPHATNGSAALLLKLRIERWFYIMSYRPDLQLLL